MDREAQVLRRRVRVLLVFFVVALVISGLTAVPIRWELEILQVIIGEGTFMGDLWPAVTQAQADPIRYVATTGADNGDCTAPDNPCATVQYAVDQANDGDEIRVATGIYTDIHCRANFTQTVYISKTVTIRGGYTTAFTGPPDPVANPTTLDAQGQGRVLCIIGPISPTIEGLRITGGDAYKGGGVYVYEATATIRNNQVFSNTADYGGGLYIYRSAATLSRNTITANSAERGGGLYLDWNRPATLSGNIIASNTASCYGGGLHMFLSRDTLLNNLVSDNQAGYGGSGVHVEGSSTLLLHTTIARNNGGLGCGLYVTYYKYVAGSAFLTNTILVSQTVGVYVRSIGDTVELEATLWGSGAWVNGTDWDGEGTIITGTHNTWGDPDFVAPDAGDYHIRQGSAALDAGVDAGVNTDIDGEPRPGGEGYDIGADECYLKPVIYLPLVMRGHE